MVNNLLIELKRRQIQDEFDELRKSNNSPQKSALNELNQGVSSSEDIHSPQLKDELVVKDGNTGSRFGSNVRGTQNSPVDIKELELQDTDNPEIKIGVKGNGIKYSVRTHRKRFFYPNVGSSNSAKYKQYQI